MKKVYELVKEVLVADNDIFFARYLENYFNEKGFNVELAADGKEAIGKITQKQFDLVIIDFVLPKISGMDVVLYINRKCRRIYEDDEIKIILPVLILTSSALIEQIERLKNVDVDFILPKGPTESLSEAMDLMIYSDVSFLDSKQKDALISKGIFPREATQDLLLELEFFEQLFEEVPMGVVILDSDTKIIRANKKALDITSFQKEDMLYREVFDVMPKEILPELKAAMKEALTDNEANPSIVNGGLNTPFYQIWISLLRQRTFVGWLMILVPW